MFPSHPVTKVQIAGYVEALDDLTPEQIEIGCRKATRTATQFPKPGHIREALSLSKIGDGESPCVRPAYLDEPQTILTPEDQKACDEYGAKLRATLKVVPPEHGPKCLCQKCRMRRNRQP